jgi:hypothetical protein
MTTRWRFTGEFKARVALEALRGDKTVQGKRSLGPVWHLVLNSGDVGLSTDGFGRLVCSLNTSPGPTVLQ